MILFQNEEILIVEKPSGIPTHRSDEGRVGFVEWLSEKQAIPLFVVHRLDAETSGVMIFAKTTKAAAQWTTRFSAFGDTPHPLAITKIYRFLTTHPLAAGPSASAPLVQPATSAPLVQRTRRSLIARVGADWTSTSVDDVDANSFTSFQMIQQLGPKLFEWEAKITTGKTHQIRLHARDLGISILGDSLYDGTPFSRVCLHAYSQQIPALEQTFVSMPDWRRNSVDHRVMQDLELLSWQLAYQTRLHFLSCLATPISEIASPDPTSAKSNATFRVLHSEDRLLRADRFGNVVWGYWYDSHSPSQEKLNRFAQFASSIGCDHWTLRWMIDRGRADYEKIQWSSAEIPSTWTAEEAGIQFEFRTQSGSSAGLFLDQRANRAWVRENSKDKSVLNLFCYTSGFGLAAALGGAFESVNVDVQKSVLDWSRQNFALNGIPVQTQTGTISLSPGPAPAELWKSDCFYFLERTVARRRKFDFIICDPPSFARNERGVFRIDRDLAGLLNLMCDCLAPQGQILLTTNFEGWNQFHFLTEVKNALPDSGYKLQKLPLPDGDYERFSQAADREPILKSCLIVAEN